MTATKILAARTPGEPIEHRHGIAGEVHEQFLAGRVGLPHGRRDPVKSFDVEIAEPAVAVAVGMMAAIFLPQQRQRHAAAAQLSMDMPPFRQRLRPRRVVAGRRDQLALQRRVVELIRYRPRDADHRGRRMYSPIAVRPIPTDRVITRFARPTGALQAQNFSNLPHRQSLGGPPLANRKGGPCPAQTADNAPRITPSTGWSLSIGLGGRFPSESVTALPRVPQYDPFGLPAPSPRLDTRPDGAFLCAGTG